MLTAIDFESPDDGILGILQELAPQGESVSEAQIIARFKESGGDEKTMPILFKTLAWMNCEGIVEWTRGVCAKLVAAPGMMPDGFWDDVEGQA